VLTGNRGLDTLKEFSGSLDTIADARARQHYPCCTWRHVRRTNIWQVNSRVHISAVEVLDLHPNGRLSLVIDEAWQSRGLGARRRGAIRREFSRQLLLETFDADWRDVVHPP
jgi:hypothetical protein